MSAVDAALRSLLERYAAVQSLQQLVACTTDYATAKMPSLPSWPRIRLAVTGNYSTQFLAQGFPIALAARQFAADVYESPYNQWRAALLDRSSPLYAFAPTHVALLLTSIELAYGALRRPDSVVQAIVASVEAVLRLSEAHVLVTLPEPLADDLSDASPAYSWRCQINDGLRAALTSPRITLVDLAPLILDVGGKQWFDDRYYDAAKLPFHPNWTPAVLHALTDALVGAIAPRCKLIVTDLDNTLWGGCVGESGYEGVDLDPAGEGRHFLRLQQFLAGLRAKGVMLAIASKNHPDTAREVFAKRGEMLLRMEDFAATEIHWEPKSRSIARILDRLKLSTSGVVFLDDNPAERAEVRRHFPEIAVPELPEDPAQRVPMLVRSGLFDHRLATVEALARSQMYVENAAREEALHNAGSYSDFLRDLQMTIDVIELDRQRERVLELIHKTNQFNLTTRRYSWPDLTSAISSGFGRCYRLRDTFGDNGVISVVAARLDTADDARIDLWLMSCRVLGRKVEDAILADIVVRARALGARRLIGEYLPTAKNELVRDLYPRLGFTRCGQTAGVELYELALDRVPPDPGPAFIVVREHAS